MKTFFTKCDHIHSIVTESSPERASERHRCKKCVRFNLKEARWEYGSIRVYEATDADLSTLRGVRQ